MREFVDRLLDNPQRVLKLLFGDDQGRRNPHDACPAGLELSKHCQVWFIYGVKREEVCLTSSPLVVINSQSSIPVRPFVLL